MDTENTGAIPSQWKTSPFIRRWCNGLLNVIGLTPSEVTSRVNVLSEFCAHYELEPETMVAECRAGEQKLACRAFYLDLARSTPANLIVQSFLIHNGINIFGDIVCMPSSNAQIAAEQGEQWIAPA